MAVLEGERGLLVSEAELVCFGPDADDVSRGGAGSNKLDRGVHVVAATLVGLHLRPGCAADGKGSVVARPIAVEGVQDVEEGGIARPQQAITEDVRVG